MTNTLSDPLIGCLLDDRYEVIERIARGGMATVYRAMDHRLGRDVALKVMHQHLAEGGEFVARFRREARAAARLVHPGIVAVFDQGTAGDAPYLVMELIDGPNLRQVLADRKALPIGEALDITEQVLDALATAHREGFVHRDIKPENVLIAQDRAKLADFGLARTISEVTAATTGTVLGTVAYLSPELVSQGHADASSDVYAVGIMCYEMIMGKQPYQGDSAITIAFQHINSTVPRPSDQYSWIPVEIDELIASLTARDPKERPADAGAALDIVRQLRRGLDDKTLQSAVPFARPPSPTTPRHRPAGLEGGSTTQVPLTSGRRPTLTPVPLGPSTAGKPRAPQSRTGPDDVADAGASPAGSPMAPEAAAMHVPQRRKRRRWVAVLAVLLVILLAAGGGVFWYLTQGPGSLVTVPSVEGWTKERAASQFSQTSLQVTYSEAWSDSVQEGSVVETHPEGGTKVKPGTTVDLVISQGVKQIPTPDVRNVDLDTAEATIEQAGLKVGQITYDYNTTVPEGVVLNQSPVPEGDNSTQAHYEPVNLVVSKGPEPITMPTFLDQSQANAQVLCTQYELKCTFGDPEFSDTVNKDLVMKQSVDAGTEAHRGDAVTLVLSKGQDLVQVPNVVLQMLDAATSALTDAGLKVSVDKQPAEPPLGLVIQQDPKANSWVPRGSTVTIKVS